MLVLVALNGCVTPVIPLPPPEPRLMALDQTKKEIVLAGDPSSAHAGALIFVFNQRTGMGTITQASPTDGRFVTQPIKVEDGDRMDIWAARFAEDDPSSIRCKKVDFTRKAIADCP